MASNKEKQSKRRRPRMRVILPQPHMLFRFKIPKPGEEYELLIDNDSLSASDACSETNPYYQTPKQKQSSSSSVTPSYFSCNLCFESERQPVVTACGHLYCHSCLCDWLRIDRKCPVCQAQVIHGHVFPIYQCSGPRPNNNTVCSSLDKLSK